MSYSCYFLLVSGSVSAALVGVVAFAVPASVFGADGRMTLALGLGAAALACLAYTLVMRGAGTRVVIRAGRWPALQQGMRFPRTYTELESAAWHYHSTNGSPPTIVGGAWGFFLYRKFTLRNCVFTHRCRGLTNVRNDEWHAGTTIHEMLDHYEKLGLTVGTHPTMEEISLGAWFATASHGNGGDLARGSSKSMRYARVLHIPSGKPFPNVEYADVRRIFDGPNAADYVITAVVMWRANFVLNCEVQKKGIEIRGPTGAAEWLEDGAHLRLCFIGAARDYAIGLRWTDVYNQNETHKDPHFCSRVCQFLQVDILSTVIGWHEKMDMFTGRSSYLDANRWMPGILPIMSTLVVLTGYLNAEVYFLLANPLTGNSLHRMIIKLIAIHKQYGGRSEVRYGAKRKQTPVFLDMSMKGSFEPIMKMLHTSFNVNEVALHPGKNQCNVAPCTRIPVGVVYGLYKDVDKIFRVV